MLARRLVQKPGSPTKSESLGLVSARFALLRRLRSRARPNQRLIALQVEFCGRAMRQAALLGATDSEIASAVEAGSLEVSCAS